MKLFNAVIWKEQVALVVGAASSRDHLISRLEAAPTGFFYGNLDFRDKRLQKFSSATLFGGLGTLGIYYLYLSWNKLDFQFLRRHFENINTE